MIWWSGQHVAWSGCMYTVWSLPEVLSGLMEGFWKGDSDLTGIRQKSAVQWAGVGMEEISEEAIGSVVLLGGLFGWVFDYWSDGGQWVIYPVRIGISKFNL